MFGEILACEEGQRREQTGVFVERVTSYFVGEAAVGAPSCADCEEENLVAKHVDYYGRKTVVGWADSTSRLVRQGRPFMAYGDLGMANA
jgi:hypothetical protein